MDLIDEKNVIGLKVGEHGRKVTGPFNDGPRGLAKLHTHLMGKNMGKGCLSQARWPEQKDVVKGIAPLACGLYEDVELTFDLWLPNVVTKCFWAKRPFEGLFSGARSPCIDQPFIGARGTGRSGWGIHRQV